MLLRPFENVPGQGAMATVDGRRVAVGSKALMDGADIDLAELRNTWTQLATVGRTVMCVGIDGTIAAVFGVADAPRETSVAAVDALRDMDVRVVMLTGDNQATAERIAEQLGITEVIADVRPGDKSARVAELQADGAKVAMVGDGVNDAPALAQADIGIAIGAGTDVAIETADLVLMRSDPLDVPLALTVGRGTLRKMRQNLGWAIGYNMVALPIAAGVFVPIIGLGLRPEDRCTGHVRLQHHRRVQRRAVETTSTAIGNRRSVRSRAGRRWPGWRRAGRLGPRRWPLRTETAQGSRRSSDPDRFECC